MIGIMIKHRLVHFTERSTDYLHRMTRVLCSLSKNDRGPLLDSSYTTALIHKVGCHSREGIFNEGTNPLNVLSFSGLNCLLVIKLISVVVTCSNYLYVSSFRYKTKRKLIK